ncbi:hypothetical protein [Glaesserella parasuis]|uniref:hypothetical protein n=2 Tax=Glaesserella parasuis TaxID=738 RepID=UPI0024366495|nr:hypothetical protein [Glaesserella parasuis]MDG6478972.1 hypothetical protein [Glaesserella parasuis]MDO9692599.1 hypothetical protein [Glaesserella parasuis]MDO9761210.1 hypothetical protein [Glaesserella parasuis]MDO9794359.1 hypothetical protein [Glaesserella parasuis]MDP0056922.1 hypothetical protein [Glaesserella parasuis]
MNKLLLIFIAIFSVTACFEQPKKDIIQEKGEDKADVEGLKAEDSKVESPKVESPKVEASKVEASKVEASKVEASKVESPKVEASKVESPKVESSKVEASKVEASKVEASKVESPKIESPKVESPKVESLKSEVSEAGASQVKIPDSKKDITEASSSDEKAGARQSISVQNEQASVVDSNNENSLLAQDINEPESQKSSKPKSLQYSINRHQESSGLSPEEARVGYQDTSGLSPEEARVGYQDTLSDEGILYLKMQCRYPLMSEQEIINFGCGTKEVKVAE